MKIVYFVTILLLAVYVQAANPWDRFEGCYETVSFDGKPITEPTNFYKSKIKYDEDIFFAKTDDSPIKSVTTAIVIKQDGTDTIVDIPLAFVDAPGVTITSLTNGVRFNFKGVAKLKRDNKNYSFAYTTEFEDIGPGKIRVKNSNTHHEFELQKTACP